MEEKAFTGTGEISKLLQALREQKEQLETQKRLLVELEHGPATDLFPEDKRQENIKNCQAVINGIKGNIGELEKMLGPDIKKH